MPTLQDTCYGFESYVLHERFSPDAAVDVDHILLCSTTLRATEECAAYIGAPDAAHQLLSRWDGLSVLNLVVAECADAREFEVLELDKLNIIVSNMPLADLYNAISTNMSNYEDWRRRLFDIQVRDDSIGTLLATAVSLFDKQISLFLLSPTFHLIDYRSVSISPENAILDMSNEGVFTESQISFLVESSQHEKSTTYSTEPILEDGMLRGYLLIIRNEDTYIPKCFVNLVTQLIPMHIYKSFPKLSERVQKLSDLLTDILLFNPNDVEPLYERLADLPFPLKPSVRMLVVTHDANRYSTMSVISDLARVFPEHNIAPYGRYIIVLLSGENFLFRPAYDQERLEQFLDKYGSYAVFTAAVRFIRGMHIFFKQATDILHLMEHSDINEGRRSAFFEDLFEYERAHACIAALKASKENNKLVYLFHPFVAELLRYDDTHNTDLLSFAIAFAENNGSIAQTASMANYHRNTIYNKINRIEELFGVNLADGTILRELIFTKHIMQIARAEGFPSDSFIVYTESRYTEDR